MSRNKKTYIGILIIITLVVTVFYFSYAFFTNLVEGKGKLNIVAGTLDYKIESDDLEDGKITLNAGEIKEIEISLKSLNNISSKYEVYYSLKEDTSNVRIGYSKDTKDGVLGTIEADSIKKITIVARNESDEDIEVLFDVIGGLSNNELVLENGESLNKVVGKYTAYNIGEEITLADGSKWHVLEVSDETISTVTLLSDYNLNSDGSYNTTCTDANGICSAMAFDSDNTNVYDESDSNNIGYFIKNTYSPLVTNVLPGTTDVTIPTAYQIAIADGQIFNNVTVTLTNSWLKTTAYWTKTAHTSASYSHIVWNVAGYANIMDNYYASSAESNGVRPVITTLKSNIVDTMSSSEVLVIGTNVEAIDGSKWHVLEASSSDSKYVTLLSDYNLNTDGTYNKECGKDVNSTYACSMMAFDSDNTIVYDEEDSNNIGYFIKNTYSPLVTKKLLETTSVTLATAEQIALADNQVFDHTDLSIVSSWLTTTNYWTKTTHNQYYRAWFVRGDGSRFGSYYTNTSDLLGARPVITTLKTNLLAQ